MEISIKAEAAANRVSIEINDLDWEGCKGQDFYPGELQVQKLVAAIGQELTKELMVAQDETAWRIAVGGTVYYKKSTPSRGHYKTLYGDMAVVRHLYQTAQGGETICPMEQNCGIEPFGSATPLLANVLAFKVSAMAADDVARDLAKGHGVHLAPSYILETAQKVGQIAVEKKTDGELSESGGQPRPVRVVATGMDGTTLPIVDEHYKMGMVGTIALYDASGERQATEYLGAMPEAGKGGFYRHFDRRVARVLVQYPEALHVVLCDGDRSHWEHIDSKYPKAIDIVDFYHASEHLAKAAEALFGPAPSEEKSGWYEYYRAELQEAAQGVHTVIRELIYQGNHKPGLRRSGRNALDKEITYFHHNAPRMHYWQYRDWGLPIGSGVTEAACKELIKSRFCRSGMRWKRESGDRILQLRAIRLSNYWETFWSKVMGCTA